VINQKENLFWKKFKLTKNIKLMKTTLLIFALIVSTSFYAQDATASFDEKLAKELGADDYGMKRYVMAFLKKGPNRTKDSFKAANLQMAHMSNIKRLAEEGKLAIAGPFLDNGEYRGIYIFNVETLEEAKKLTESDPAIKAGSLVMELHPWYGSAALGLANKYHSKIAKIKM